MIALRAAITLSKSKDQCQHTKTLQQLKEGGIPLF
jgi:hypothetical protein